MTEQQNVEYKTSWRDEYLKWVCGFANAQGGKIFIGMDDHGKVCGVADHKRLMDDIPNKTVNHLGLMVDVNLHKENGRCYIEIDVPVSTVPVSYHGAYYYRCGSTKQELKGTALHDFLLRKMGRTWDDLPIERTGIADIDERAVTSFIKTAIASGRIFDSADNDSLPSLLDKLQLLTEKGELKAAAVLLFGKNPMKHFITCYFKIGRFGASDSDLRFQDTIEGNIFGMADRVIKLLKERYLVSPIIYEGIRRIEKLEYPEPALREAILNAIVHKDYAGSTIQLSVYDNKLVLWNPGKLPDDINVEMLKSKHASRPRNKHIAEIFFRAGYIESWGRGIDKILNTCRLAGLPEPVFEEASGGFQVTFLKDIYVKEHFDTLGLPERQQKALLYIKEKGSITNKEYQQLTNITKRTASRDLQELVDRQLISRIGVTGKGTSYILKITKGANGATMGS